ncbi:MAG TPA: PAS domain S-box protein [Burkholderiaceae bacterium]|jgi:PAS domain S-box-containing protein|nr:PAS domain S-box protein [Burkholderiaceae bacterium]
MTSPKVALAQFLDRLTIRARILLLAMAVFLPGAVALEQARQRTAFVGAAALLLACALAWKLASVIARPVASLQAAVRRVATGDLAGHVRVDGPPEMRRVAEDFNRMVDALALSRSRLQALFDTMSEAVVTVDDAQTVVVANPAAATLLRCPMSVLIGSKLDRWIPEHARDAHRLDVERFGSSAAGPRDMGHRPEIAALCFDGEETPVEASISMVEHEGRRLYTAVLRDVSERRKAMTALARNKALLTAALANMSDAVTIVDAHGLILAVNDAFSAFYRLSPAGPAPRSVQELAALLDIHRADGRAAGANECAGLQAIAGHSGTGVLYRLRRLDGGEPWIGSFNFAPIRDASGTITGAVSTARDVTTQLAAQQELERSRDALRRLVGSLDRSIDDERRRISRELHDDLQQTLAAIGLESSAALRLTPAPQGVLHDALLRIESLSHGALRSTRRIIADLRPQLLEELGLAAALCHMADVHARRHHMSCDVEVDDEFDAEALPELVATCLYRVAQEALHNVARHAGATHVHVRLRMVDGHAVRLEILDDGRGLETDAGDRPRGFGLLGMSERVHALAGSLRVWSPPGGGTAVDAQLPLDLGGGDEPAAEAAPQTS